jgi:hypothetical protein
MADTWHMCHVSITDWPKPSMGNISIPRGKIEFRSDGPRELNFERTVHIDFRSKFLEASAFDTWQTPDRFSSDGSRTWIGLLIERSRRFLIRCVIFQPLGNAACILASLTCLSLEGDSGLP